MNAERLIFDCVFLNDTQMADLAREQTSLRQAWTHDSDSANSRNRWLPFNFLTPFCPYAPGSGRMTVDSPITIDGWIVRPVSFENGVIARAAPAIPQYPALPSIPCVILGHADPERPDQAQKIADRLITEALKEAGTNSPPRSFSVAAWYSATLTLGISWEARRFFSATTEIGKPSWNRKK